MEKNRNQVTKCRIEWDSFRACMDEKNGRQDGRAKDSQDNKPTTHHTNKGKSIWSRMLGRGGGE